MKLYNTLTRSLEEFTPLEDKKVLFYHCGPTVYWTQHIGNLRGMTAGDILVRTLRYFGYTVTHVRNYTDVGHLTSDADTGEDKMEKGARREGMTPDEVAQKYIDIFEADTKEINLREPDVKPRPSKLIPEIISMVETLLTKGYAYTTDFAVYFDVSKFPGYTRLSRQNLEKSKKGSGKGEADDPGKKHFADFALWIFKKGPHANALQTWESPWGVGFPGWHIECSVMARKYLGETIDIHMGGVEHIPIHHTNEIAQSEAVSGEQFVKYWMHNEHLVINQEKMAKSQGTGLSVAEIKKRGYDPLALRYFYLTAQYRTRQNFTWEALTAVQAALNELRSQVAILRQQATERSQLSSEKLEKYDAYRIQFDEALSNDLNTPMALAVVWEALKSNIPSQDKLDLLLDFDEVLGLDLRSVEAKVQKTQVTRTLPESGSVVVYAAQDTPEDAVLALVDDREVKRRNKDFTAADAIRGELENRGILIEDTAGGVLLKKKA